VIIDGVFHQEPAVPPREILDVLEDGAVIVGASSMGALRAAECWPAGMRGVGTIYRLYRRGALKSDDEVIGVLYVMSAIPDKFKDEDVELLSALATQATISIKNAKLYQQVREHATSQLTLLLRRPAAEALPRLHAELAVCHELPEYRQRPWRAVEIRQYRLVYRKCQIGANEIGVLQGPQYRKASSETRLDDSVDRFCVANTMLD